MSFSTCFIESNRIYGICQCRPCATQCRGGCPLNQVCHYNPQANTPNVCFSPTNKPTSTSKPTKPRANKNDRASALSRDPAPPPAGSGIGNLTELEWDVTELEWMTYPSEVEKNKLLHVAMISLVFVAMGVGLALAAA